MIFASNNNHTLIIIFPMKIKYIPPIMEIILIQLDNSIAAGSATATFIGPIDQNSPDVESWSITPNNSNDDPAPTSIENW